MHFSNSALLALGVSVYLVTFNVKVALTSGAERGGGFDTDSRRKGYDDSDSKATQRQHNAIQAGVHTAYRDQPDVVPVVSAQTPVTDSTNNHKRVIVVSIWTHYPDLMRLQVASLRNFVANNNTDLLYIAVLNSQLAEMNQQLGKTADALNVMQVLININYNKDSSAHHGYALNQAMQFLLLTNGPIVLRAETDIVWILDSDIFLTGPTNLLVELQNNPLVSMMQSRYGLQYLWPNFLILHLQHLKDYKELDFAPAIAQDSNGTRWSLDSGGSTSIFIASHPEIAVTGIRNIECNDASDLCEFYRQQVQDVPDHCSPPTIMEYSERQDRCVSTSSLTYEQASDCQIFARFYHLGSAGSNWRGCPEGYLRQKRKILKEFFMAKMSPHVIEQHFEETNGQRYQERWR